jgi:hypothetical protein
MLNLFHNYMFQVDVIPVQTGIQDLDSKQKAMDPRISEDDTN